MSRAVPEPSRQDAATREAEGIERRRSWTCLDLERLDAESERPAWLALAAVPGVGPVAFARALARFGSARAALAQPAALLEDLSRADASTREALEQLQALGPDAVATDLLRSAHRVGGQAVTALDPYYPPALTRLDPRPPVLYVLGTVEATHDRNVGLVGTRRPTGYGRSTAAQLADDLARSGVTVVSGLALGIDSVAHEGALAAGGLTVAVVPSPLDRIYPPRNRGLAARIIAQGGAVLTELPPGRQPGMPDFARRNRIISGLSEAVVVVEAPDRSGALLTAAAAGLQGRELFAVPGPIDSAASRGTNRLIADHQAEIVTSSAALLQRIGALRARGPVAVQALSEAEALVLGNLLQRSGSVDELVDRTRLETGALAGALTLLESRGLVSSYGGVTFHPTPVAKGMGERR
jgi:DNA processing protein